MIPHRGLRHVALRVSNLARSVEFYSQVFGMKVVWQPDPDNAYLSSGCDNLALHRDEGGGIEGQKLDHIGFIAATETDVEKAFEWASSHEIPIAKELAHHRDGSVSFYLYDPDRIVIQVLYEPSISNQSLVPHKL